MPTTKIRVLAPNFVQRGSQPGDVFNVPTGQAERLIRQGRAERTDARTSVPDDSWTVDDLRAYAGENGVDLGGASRKADILTAINDATEAETSTSRAKGPRESGPTSTPTTTTPSTPIDTSAEQS